MRPSEIANAIKPFVLGWIKDVSSNSGSSGGAGTGVAVHDFLGPYHTRPSLSAGQFLASPAAATGLPDFRSIALSDIQSVADTRYALAGRLINAGGGLTGGGALTADVTIDVGAGTGITVGADAVNVNQGFAFSWSASHAFGAGLTVSGANTITFGGDVTLSRSAADVLALGANDSVGTSTFTSGFTGTGWRVNYAAATGYSAEFDNLVVRQQMRVYELLIHKIRSGNGSYLFAPGGKVATVTGTGPYTLTFETDHGMAVNDLARAQKFDAGLGGGVYQSNIQVTSITDTKTLVATLSSGVAPAAGFEFVRIGNTTNTSRQGGVYITADDTNAPYIHIYDGVASFADWQSASKARTQIGKMNSTYGAGAGNWGFGVGDYSSNNYLRYADDATGFLLRAGNGAVQIDAGGVQINQTTALTEDPLSAFKFKNTTHFPNADIGLFSFRIASTGESRVNLTNYTTRYGASSAPARTFITSYGAAGSYLSLEGGVTGVGGGVITLNELGTTTGTFFANNINVGSATGAASGEVRASTAMVAPVHGASGTQPIFYFNETDAGADQKLWEISPLATVLSFRAFNDAYNASTTWMNVVRGTGTAVTGVDVLTRFSVTNNGAGARWIGTDHFYHEFYPDGLGAGRKGYFGYPAAGNDNLTFANEISGAHINLLPTGAGRVGINTSSPRSKLEIFDTDSSFNTFRASGMTNAAATVVIADGTNDATLGAAVFGVATDSAGTTYEVRGAVDNGANAAVAPPGGAGTDRIDMHVLANGQVEFRIVGGRTWSVRCFVTHG